MRRYVIRARKNEADKTPFYVSLETANGKPLCTTDIKKAAVYGSLLSADVQAQGFNEDVPDYQHAVDLYKE